MEKKKSEMVSVEAWYIAAPYRDELLIWLKAGSTDQSECRVLTNVRCLSEGVTSLHLMQSCFCQLVIQKWTWNNLLVG